MLALPLHVMSVLAINLLISWYQMTAWWAEVMLVNWSAYYRLFYVSEGQSTFCLVLPSSVTSCMLSIYSFHDFWFKRETRQAFPPLSSSFSLFQSNLFLYVTLFAMFLIPPILRSHYSAVELCNGARGYQLNEFCPVASIYCAPSQMKVILCECTLTLAAHVSNINQGFSLSVTYFFKKNFNGKCHLQVFENSFHSKTI